MYAKSNHFFIVTHQHRGQIQRELHASGISIEYIKHFLACLNDAWTSSYIVNLCVDALMQRSGCNIMDKKFHDQTWGLKSTEYIIRIALPVLHEELEKVNHVLHRNYLTKAEETSICLITARVTLE